MQRFALLLATVVLAAPGSANALGLGEIEVSSRLNDRLEARIPLVGARSGEVEDVRVRLADPDVYEAAGATRASLLSTLRFEVVPDAVGGGHVRIASPEPVREPAIDLIVEVSWGEGRLLREYSLLLSLP